MNHAIRKALRTLVQLVAAGGLTALVNAIAEGLSPNYKAVVLALNMVLVTWAQNALESSGTVPTLLPSPSTSGASAPLAAKTTSGVVPPPAPGQVGGVPIAVNRPEPKQ